MVFRGASLFAAVAAAAAAISPLPWMLLLFLAVTAAEMASPLPWATSPEIEGFNSSILQNIAPEVQQLIHDKVIPGAVVLGARHGKLVLNVTAGGQAFSWDQGEPIFRLFSMSKPIVAILALALLDQGLFSLDDPLGKYIPELATPTIYKGIDALHNWITDPAPRCATVQELMTHTAGFSYGFDMDHPVDRAYALAGFADMRDLPSSDAFINLLKSIPLRAAPNTTWQYSISFDVLGVLLERVTAQPLDAILHEHLTKPLQLFDTDFYVPLYKAHRLPAVDVQYNDTPYSLRPMNEHYRPSFFSGGAGLYSSASDYLRIAQMLLNGGELDGVRILSEDAVKAMTKNQLPGPLLPFHLGNFQGSAFGFGIQITTPNEMAPNRPLGEISWGGFAGTYFYVDPPDGTIIIALTQHAPMNGALPGAVKPSFFSALRQGGG